MASPRTFSFAFCLHKFTPLCVVGSVCWKSQKRILICFSWAVQLTLHIKFLVWQFHIFNKFAIAPTDWLIFTYLCRCAWKRYRSNTLKVFSGQLVCSNSILMVTVDVIIFNLSQQWWKKYQSLLLLKTGSDWLRRWLNHNRNWHFCSFVDRFPNVSQPQ